MKDEKLHCQALASQAKSEAIKFRELFEKTKNRFYLTCAANAAKTAKEYEKMAREASE